MTQLQSVTCHTSEHTPP